MADHVAESNFWHVLVGVMIAWTGIEHFRMGRYESPPPPNEPEDAVVRSFFIFFIAKI